MKLAALAVGLTGTVIATVGGMQSQRTTSLVVTGDFLGHLQPCGCTSPQLGGLGREATFVRQLEKSSDVVFVSNGALVANANPQEQLKLQTLAESLASLNVAAINLSPEDAEMGYSGLLTIQNITKRKLICGNLSTGMPTAVDTEEESNGMLIGGVSVHPELVAQRLGRQVTLTDDAVEKLLVDAKDRSDIPVILLNGNEQEAKALATKYPDIGLVVFRSASDIPLHAAKIGNTLLVTPGEFGKGVVRLTFSGHEFTEYQSVPLEPAYRDDPEVSQFYKTYLATVDQGTFLDQYPRHSTEPYAGTPTCAKCHATDYKIWQHTKHAQAFADLEKAGNRKDPDCVFCHVAGLNSTSGFRSRKLTPDLANVGCESCHGPGERHSKLPKRFRMTKISTEKCSSCHTPDQSPNFIALISWGKIQHH
jgi:hypothetical protein